MENKNKPLTKAELLWIEMVSACKAANEYVNDGYVIISHLKRENYYLEQHQNCVNYYSYDYTDYECKLCDSLIKYQYYAKN